MRSERDIIVQLIITRKYNKQGITLPDNFWRLPKYKDEYKKQAMVAAKLLRVYSAKAILNVLEKESWCWSLHAKRLPDLIEKEQTSLDIEKKIQELKEPQESKPVDLPLFRKRPNV